MIRTKWLIGFFAVAWMASAAVVLAQDEEAAKEPEQKAKADPTGTWKWERTFGNSGITMQYTLRLKQQDGKLTGTLDTIRDEEPLEPSEIEEAMLEGNKIAFAVTREFNGNEFTIDYEGTVEENAINGLTKVDFGGQEREFEWAAKRGLDWKDVLGEWKMASETPDGSTFEWMLKFTKEGDDVKGTVTSERFGENELSEIAIKDAQLTFALVGDNNGNEFRLSYKIDPRGDSLKGSMQWGENAEQAFEFTGKRVKEKENDAGDGDAQE